MSVEYTQDGTQDVASDRLALVASLQAEPPVAGPPEIPGYSMKGLLGEGTFGRVYKAIQTRTGQSVAIKILTVGGDRGYLEREVARLAQVAEHPYVCHLLDANVAHNPPYLVTPLLDRSLTSFVHRRPGLEQAATWMEQIAEALQYIHLRGLLHFDLKPANVLMDSAGNARLMDFGQARLAGREAASLGTFWYMPPEQVWLSARRSHVKQPEPSWDIYALGATMYEVLTGTRPRWTEEFSQQLNAPAELLTRLETYRLVLSQTPLRPIRVLNPNVDAALARIVEKCLQINPNRRYKELATLVNDLRTRKRTAAVGPTPGTLLIGVGAACVASLLVGLLLGRGGGSPAPTPIPTAVAMAQPTPAPVKPVLPAPKPKKSVAVRTRPRPTVTPTAVRPLPVKPVRPSQPEVVTVVQPRPTYPRHRQPTRPVPPPPQQSQQQVAVRPETPPAARPEAGPTVFWPDVQLRAPLPAGFEVQDQTIGRDESFFEASDSAEPGRRVVLKVQNISSHSFKEAWGEAENMLRREWRVEGAPEQVGPPQGPTFQARWFKLVGRGSARCLVMVRGGDDWRLYTFLCVQDRGDALPGLRFADYALRGVEVAGSSLPFP